MMDFLSAENGMREEDYEKAKEVSKVQSDWELIGLED